MPEEPNEPTPNPEPKGGETKTFTQEQVDSIVANRLHEERAKYADYDDLKAAAARLEELEEAEKSELEKAQERAAELERKAEQAEQSARRLKLERAVERAASEKGAIDVEVITKVVDLDGIEVDESGNPTNVDDVLGGLKESKPHLFTEQGTPPPRRPQEVRSGTLPSTEPEPDVDDILEKVPPL